MSPTKSIRAVITTVLCLLNFLSYSQDTIQDRFIPEYQKEKFYQINTVYGTIYRGPVVEETKHSIIILNKKTNGKIALNKYEIKDHKLITTKDLFNGLKFDDGYYSNNYMLTENALPFKKGGLNATAHYFLVDNINYSFNENFGISTNVFVFLPVSIGLKCSFKISEDIYAGGNAYIYGTPSDEGFMSPFMGASGRVTKGNDEQNFSLGGGIIFARVTDSLQLASRTTKYDQAYYFSFSYSNRFSKHAALSIESILFPQVNLNMTGASIKWIRDPSDQWNFGCYALYIGDFKALTSNARFVPIPYLSYSVFFD